MKYKRISTHTHEGLQQAEGLLADGWTIVSSGLFTILFKKEK